MAKTKRNLRLRVSIIVVGLLIAIHGILGAYDLVSSSRDLTSELQSRGTNIADRMAESLGVAVSDFDLTSAKRITGAEMKDPVIEAIIVRQSGQSSSKVFLGQVRGNDGTVKVAGGATPDLAHGLHKDLVKQSADDVREIILTRPITNDIGGKKEQMGEIEIHLTRRLADAALKGAAIKTTLSTAGIAVILAVILVVVLSRTVFKPMENLAHVALEIAATQDYSRQLEVHEDNEIGQVVQALNRLTERVARQAEKAQSIAAGNLTVEIDVVSDKDVLGKSLAQMTRDLNTMLHQVDEASQSVSRAATDVATFSASLSEVANQQAVSLEQIANSLREIGAQTQENAANAAKANDTATQAREVASKGNGTVLEMVESMREMHEAGQHIVKIVKAIDDVAFQTNLLALNAAVEAARAGQHGKGFAVVAEEVRNLAGRSADAAKETADLLQSTVQKVEQGTSIAGRTEVALKEIVTSSAMLASVVECIATASHQQADGLNLVTQGLAQLDLITQKNTANAEKTASAASLLTEQAGNLRQMMEHFQLREEGGPTRRLA